MLVVVKVTSASCNLKLLCGGASLHSLNIIVALNVMLVHVYTVVSVIPYTALTVNLCMQVNIKRVLGVPFAHGTADLVRGHPALARQGRGNC